MVLDFCRRFSSDLSNTFPPLLSVVFALCLRRERIEFFFSNDLTGGVMRLRRLDMRSSPCAIPQRLRLALAGAPDKPGLRSDTLDMGVLISLRSWSGARRILGVCLMGGRRELRGRLGLSDRRPKMLDLRPDLGGVKASTACSKILLRPGRRTFLSESSNSNESGDVRKFSLLPAGGAVLGATDGPADRGGVERLSMVDASAFVLRRLLFFVPLPGVPY
mmetsp:Transcript_29072/g.84493  ORF Transcript_29072/g.84493 Transcript_29072/m.84493 type:complete len:219 (-) Transcript_29072:1850-2506(-)